MAKKRRKTRTQHWYRLFLQKYGRNKQNSIIVTVITKGHTICTTTASLLVSQSKGYISSAVARDRGCGSMKAPWRIEAEPGQSVNVSLINYTPDQKARSGRCRPLGYIYDVAQNNNMSICDTATTHENVYVSISHIVDIQLLTDIIEEHSFLLQYTGI